MSHLLFEVVQSRHNFTTLARTRFPMTQLAASYSSNLPLAFNPPCSVLLALNFVLLKSLFLNSGYLRSLWLFTGNRKTLYVCSVACQSSAFIKYCKVPVISNYTLFAVLWVCAVYFPLSYQHLLSKFSLWSVSVPLSSTCTTSPYSKNCISDKEDVNAIQICHYSGFLIFWHGLVVLGKRTWNCT